MRPVDTSSLTLEWTVISVRELWVVTEWSSCPGDPVSQRQCLLTQASLIIMATAMDTLLQLLTSGDWLLRSGEFLLTILQSHCILVSLMFQIIITVTRSSSADWWEWCCIIIWLWCNYSNQLKSEIVNCITSHPGHRILRWEWLSPSPDTFFVFYFWFVILTLSQPIFWFLTSTQQ